MKKRMHKGDTIIKYILKKLKEEYSEGLINNYKPRYPENNLYINTSFYRKQPLSSIKISLNRLIKDTINCHINQNGWTPIRIVKIEVLQDPHPKPYYLLTVGVCVTIV